MDFHDSYTIDTSKAESELDSLNESLAYTQKALDQVRDAYDRGDVSQAAYQNTAARLHGQMQKIGEAIDKVAERKRALNDAFVAGPDLARAFLGTKDAATQTEVSLVGAGAGATRFGKEMRAASTQGAQSLMMLGNTLDDLQYVGSMGLRPIVNNIMQIAPQVGIALIGLDLLRKGIAAAVEAVRSEDELSGFASDVDVMKKKVEDLEGVWIKTAAAIRDARQARMDLKAAEGAEKSKQAQSDEDKEAKRRYETALSETPGGGNGAESVIRALVGNEFSKNGVGMVQQDLQSGRITHDVASSMGLNNQSTRQQIADAMENPQVRGQMREISVGARVNEAMSGMESGNARTNADVLGMFGRHDTLGQKDESGQFTNPFARALAGGGKKADEKALDEESERLGREAIESGKALSKQMKDARKREAADVEAEEQYHRDSLQDFVRGQREAKRDRKEESDARRKLVDKQVKLYEDVYGKALQSMMAVGADTGTHPGTLDKNLSGQLTRLLDGKLPPGIAGDVAQRMVGNAREATDQAQLKGMVGAGTVGAAMFQGDRRAALAEQTGGLGMFNLAAAAGAETPRTARGRARQSAAMRRQFNAQVRGMFRSPAQNRAAMRAMQGGLRNYVHPPRTAEGGGKASTSDKLSSLDQKADKTNQLLEQIAYSVRNGGGIILS